MRNTWVDVNSALGLNGKPELLTEAQAIYGSLYNLFMCQIGTRGWQPTYGSDLPKLLWEPIDEMTAQRIRIAILTAVKEWEPRIELLPGLSRITPNYVHVGYDIYLVYRVKSSGQTVSAEFSFAR